LNNSKFEISSSGKLKDIIGIRDPDYLSSNGRYYTYVPTKDNREILYPTDYLVASAHVPVPIELEGKQIKPHHKDGSLTNVEASNLEWVEDIEEWKDVDFWGIKKGLYQISNHGRVRSLINDIILIPNLYSRYPRVTISLGRYHKTMSIHRLVAKAFIPGESNERNCVNHINGNKADPHYINLEWVSDRENKDHAAKSGLLPKGDDSVVAKISENDAKRVCEALNKYEGNIMKAYLSLKDAVPTLTYPIVSMIKYRECFKYISDRLLTEVGASKQERQTDPDIILDVAKCLKNNNGDVRKTRDQMISKYPWISLGWIWHLKDKSVASEVTDQVFSKDEFPKTVPLTESDVDKICECLLKHKGDQYASENVRQELESEIPGLTREKVRCIKDKRAWASYTDKYFKKGDI
jgi:hypothetical protein